MLNFRSATEFRMCDLSDWCIDLAVLLIGNFSEWLRVYNFFRPGLIWSSYTKIINTRNSNAGPKIKNTSSISSVAVRTQRERVLRVSKVHSNERATLLVFDVILKGYSTVRIWDGQCMITENPFVVNNSTILPRQATTKSKRKEINYR